MLRTYPLTASRDDTWTIGRLLQWTTGFFQDRRIDSPRLDAEVLLAHVLACRRIDLYALFDEEVTPADRTRFRELVKERAQGRPVAYLVGAKEFYSIDFVVNSSVLIPRPATEFLVGKAIALLPKDQPSHVLDIGTGSGAIAVAIARHRPQAQVVAIDIEPAALAVAQTNIERHQLSNRVETRLGSLFDPIEPHETFDLITSNPPYIRSFEFNSLPTDIRMFEPKSALVAGADGLDALRPILQKAPEFLKPGGWLLLEFGIDHAPILLDLVNADPRLRAPEIIDDMERHPRVLVAQRVDALAPQ